MLVSVVALALAVGGVARASAPRSAQPVALSGNEEVFWIVASDWDGEQQQFLNWLAWMDPSSLTVRSARLPAQLGQVRAAATVSGRLHLFFAHQDQKVLRTSHYAFVRGLETRTEGWRPGEARRQLRLPADALPLAVAGGDGWLWAVVTGGTAQKVLAQWQAAQSSEQREGTSEPGAEGGTQRAPELLPTSQPEELPVDRLYLVKYDGRTWQPGHDVPADLRVNSQVWLVVDSARQHLFWSHPPGSGSVHYVHREADAWTGGPDLELEGRIAGAFAGVLNKQLVFAALLHERDSNDARCEPRVLSPAGDQWNRRPPLQGPAGNLVLPAGTVLGGISDKLAVLRKSTQGVELGLWSPADGQMIRPFEEVPIRTSAASVDPSDRLSDVVPLAIVMVVILLVYWLRQDSLASPILVPPGPTAASFARRATAALIDMAPAAAVVLVIWWDPVISHLKEVRANFGTVQSQDAPPLASLTVPWFTGLLIYAGYCTFFEIRWSATPGKRLLRCQVMSEQLERPKPLQIVIRNAARLLELEPHLHVWPFLLVMFMTRNRQRLGDMLARTLVIEGRPADLEEQESKESGSDEFASSGQRDKAE